ncbi:MAG TPA: pyridoxal phosphate-dependent aminotransferase [Terracidiphilus sp.]|jgi:histidinol-phosphate/aromatic aminotransferase/cobyric acid decarboxylase-like protein|nr:pyridoxal phosphate-dependent aminotransferase [Terracidiphilus sp.]
MAGILNKEQEEDLLLRGFTRRGFLRLAAMVAGASSMPFYNEPALAQLSKVTDAPSDAVMINANENPLGPCPEAMEAVHNIVAKGGRYLYGETDKLQAAMATQEDISPDSVRIFVGSSPALHQAVLAFTSPTRPLVIADPGYEAGERAANFIGTPVVKVPLTPTYAHDVKAMASASATAGLIYICNPNNPSGTLTPKSEIEWLVANKPAGSVVMIDEAYTHIAGAPFNSDLVAQGKDVVLLRTFSKIYGMAGLRAGAAIARPELLDKLGEWGATMMPITGMVAATASLQSKDLVPTRRRLIAQVREDTFNFLERNNYKFVPSVSNCFMVDTGRPGSNAVLAMRKEKVYVGRVWPVWPEYVRVTVGTADEMKKFQIAFSKVMSA